MCGISGFISPNQIFSKDDLIAMSDTMSHRGPDDSGYYLDSYCGLAHRRLSVMDVSNAGHQPMYSHCGKFIIVFNGEVYNFKEIAKELNIKPKTGTDTEIILEAFILLGANFVNKLNGMFTIVIYEIETQAIWIFRDRVGIKPLYIYSDSGTIAFASELKGLKKLVEKKINLTISQESIYEYLHMGFISEPRSIYSQINKFPSGHYLFKDKNKPEQYVSYWNLSEKISKSTDSFETAKNKLSNLIRSSIEYRMVADVPFGTFLSGGIDSSLVTAMASQISSKPLNTYTIGFEDKKYSEASHASEIAKYLGTNHHELILTEKDAIYQIDEFLNTYDEPFSDTSALPTLLVSKFAREGVTMTLVGDGGDELFQGYGAYAWAKRLHNPLVHTFRSVIGNGLNLIPDNRFKRAALLFNYKKSNEKFDHIFSQEQYMFNKYETLSLLKDKSVVARDYLSELQMHNFELDIQSKQALFDFKYYLKDDLLVKVDRATMRHSLEARVPLLDYRIAEYAFSLPIDYKIKNGETKHILKSILFDLVPKEYYNRPKRGFSIPLIKWLKNDLKYLITDYTNSEIIEMYGILDNNQVQKLVKDFLSGKDYLYNKVWLVINLNMWLIKNA